MRKIIVLSMLSLDGVMQAPGGPQEDTSGGFQYGGWVAPLGDEISGKVVRSQLKPADLLLGRKTFDIFASYWPAHGDFWPSVNTVTKYCLSRTKKQSDWNNSVFLDSVDGIKKVKESDGLDLQVHGSGELVRLLLQHGLVDELWLKIYPLLLGKGKKLFADNAAPSAFTLTEQVVSSKGVILANYKRSGEVKTGAIGI